MPFEQGGGKITQRYGGTGLGLAISQEILAEFGGRLEIAAPPGQGVTATAILPQPQAHPPGSAP